MDIPLSLPKKIQKSPAIQIKNNAFLNNRMANNHPISNMAPMMTTMIKVILIVVVVTLLMIPKKNKGLRRSLS